MKTVKVAVWVLLVPLVTGGLLVYYMTPLISAHLLRTEVSCFFYDKPPRTGSTTVARALEACLEEKGYTSIRKEVEEIEREDVVTSMLSKKGDKKSAVAKHVLVSDEDINALQTQCAQLFYLTSCRPMRQRITSAAKYGMSKRHGNSTLTAEQFRKAKGRANRDESTEDELERYPFTGTLKIEPNYVIRSDELDTDLRNLLTSLNCSTDYKKLNMHRLESGGRGDRMLARSLSLKYGDAKYKELSRVASTRNLEGQKFAALF